MISPCRVLPFGFEGFDSFLKGELLCKQRFFGFYVTSVRKPLFENKKMLLDSHHLFSGLAEVRLAPSAVNEGQPGRHRLVATAPLPHPQPRELADWMSSVS